MTEKISKDEQIGFHKGAISTLAKERAELVKMVGVVEQLMQMHLQALNELGVKIEGTETQQKTENKPKKRIDELIQ